MRPRCTDQLSEVGPQDYVIVTLKAHSLPAAAPGIATLLGPETTVVAAVNGVPWWYFHALAGPHQGRIVESVDPGGVVSRHLPPERVVGCVVYPAAEVVAPGVIQHIYGERYSLGEPDGTRSPRASALSATLGQAGLKAPVRPRLRDELWLKLWGNMAFNPLSLLTGATLDVLIGDTDTRALCRAMMLEGQAVAEALGCASPSMSTGELRAPPRSGRTRHPCCRIWSVGGRWSSTRCSARWWSWLRSPGLRCPCARRSSRSRGSGRGSLECYPAA